MDIVGLLHKRPDKGRERGKRKLQCRVIELTEGSEMFGDRPEDTLVVREIDGETLILDTHKNLVHQLNQTASLVWKLGREGWPPEAMADAFVQDFEVDGRQALDDIRSALAQLEALSLLPEPPSAAS